METGPGGKLNQRESDGEMVSTLTRYAGDPGFDPRWLSKSFIYSLEFLLSGIATAEGLVLIQFK